MRKVKKMSENEEIELCKLLTKLLVSIYNEVDGIADCDLAYTINAYRVKVHIDFEVGESDE